MSRRRRAVKALDRFLDTPALDLARSVADEAPVAFVQVEPVRLATDEAAREAVDEAARGLPARLLGFPTRLLGPPVHYIDLPARGPVEFLPPLPPGPLRYDDIVSFARSLGVLPLVPGPEPRVREPHVPDSVNCRCPACGE